MAAGTCRAAGRCPEGPPFRLGMELHGIGKSAGASMCCGTLSCLYCSIAIADVRLCPCIVSGRRWAEGLTWAGCAGGEGCSKGRVRVGVCGAGDR